MDNEKKSNKIFKENLEIYFKNDSAKMGLYELISNVSIEVYGTEPINLEKYTENKSKQLQKILKRLNIENIMDNKLNKTGNKKTFPVYQLLFFRRLLLEIENGNKMIKKIGKNKFEDITETEIKKFYNDLLDDFQKWSELYEEKYLGEDDLWLLNEILEDIDNWEVSDEDIEDDNEKKIYYYLRTQSQMGMFYENLLSILHNKHRLNRMRIAMSRNMIKRIYKIFQLETIDNLKIDSLDRCKIFEEVIDLPASLLNGEENLLDELKLFLLENFQQDFDNLLKIWGKIIEDFPKELEKQRIAFVDEKTDIKPNKERALANIKEKYTE